MTQPEASKGWSAAVRHSCLTVAFISQNTPTKASALPQNSQCQPRMPVTKPAMGGPQAMPA